MSKTMIFVPPGDEDVQIGLTSGHSAIVKPEGTELAPIFHAMAIAKGCLPKGIEAYQAPKSNEPSRSELIRSALQRMLDSTEDGLFSQNGRPVLKMVSKFAGFGCSREEVDALWGEVTAPAGNGNGSDTTDGGDANADADSGQAG